MADADENISVAPLWQNSTDVPPFEFSDYTQRVIVATLYLIVILVGTCGNTLVIWAVLLSKKLRTATNAFVISLSIADLLTCLVLPYTVAATLNRNELPIAEWLCSMTAVVEATAIGCSMYTLASIGLQRLLLITRPMTTYRVIYTRRKLAVWVLITWLVPLLFTLLPPLLDVGAVGYNKKYHHCGFPSTHPQSNEYDLIIAGGLYPLPLLTIIICYALIWRHLRRHTKRLGSPEESMNTNSPALSETVPIRQSVSLDSKHKTQMTGYRQYQITKNMFYIVCAFLVCLTPFAICLFYDDSDPFLPYASAILVFNSCVNPLIYATKHRDFKTVFRCILRWKLADIPEPTDFLKSLITQRQQRRSQTHRRSRLSIDPLHGRP